VKALPWLRRVGIAASFVILGPLLLVMLLFFAVLAPFTVIPVWMEKRKLVRRFRAAHVARGRFVLFAYTDSPHWQEYIERRVLPRITDRAVIVNRSRRSDWRSAMPDEARMLERLGGDRNYNPIAIIVPPTGSPETIRLFEAFRDHKHGRPQALEAALHRLFTRVDELAG
jgi:hypothetical protein